MNRDEAVLRELNLYPLWRLREGGGETAGHPAASSPRGLREGGGETAGSPAASPLRGLREGGGEAAEPVAPSHEQHKQADAVPVTEVPQENAQVAEPAPTTVEPAVTPPEKNREQTIGELGWSELKAMVRDCTDCKLRAGCTQTVFGVGDEKADWLFVGEGPGADEDARGEPFVGQAGKLLDNMLMSIKLKRGRNVYIANIVKCRPPNNRAPAPDEVATCMPYLQRQVDLIKPKLIVALGKTAATSLLGREASIASMRGKLHDFHGIPLLVTYHPAYLLRTPMDKAKAWDDLCLAVETMKDS